MRDTFTTTVDAAAAFEREQSYPDDDRPTAADLVEDAWPSRPCTDCPVPSSAFAATSYIGRPSLDNDLPF